MDRFRLTVLGFVALVAAGCSRNGAEVSLPKTGAVLEGTVYLGDKPVTNAMVIVVRIGAGGGSATGTTDQDGHYRIENVPTGDVTIGVNSDAAKGMAMGQAMSGVDQNKKGSKVSVPKVSEVPKQYFDPLTSGVKTSITSGENKYDIRLK